MGRPEVGCNKLTSFLIFFGILAAHHPMICVVTAAIAVVAGMPTFVSAGVPVVVASGMATMQPPSQLAQQV